MQFSDCYTYFGVKKKSSSSIKKGKTMYVKAKAGLNVRNEASIKDKKVGALLTYAAPWEAGAFLSFAAGILHSVFLR